MAAKKTALKVIDLMAALKGSLKQAGASLPEPEKTANAVTDDPDTSVREGSANG